MKTLAVVLMLAVAFSFGNALRCNHCLHTGCRNKVQQCDGHSDVCALVFFRLPSRPDYFKRCMKQSDCNLLRSQPTLMTVTCCMTDLCN